MGKPVILRVVDGRIPAGQLDAVQGALERDYVPAAERRRGLERYVVATRPVDDGHEIAILTVWSDIDAALGAYGGDLTSITTLDGVDHGETLDRVDYYEIDQGEARRRPGIPRFLRLSAGSVGRGLDADIQRDLRERLADLDPEAVDAYVGRRVKAGKVEISLASAWTQPPAGGSLDDPIWPDLSASFDWFSIRVLDVLIDGAPVARR